MCSRKYKCGKAFSCYLVFTNFQKSVCKEQFSCSHLSFFFPETSIYCRLVCVRRLFYCIFWNKELHVVKLNIEAVMTGLVFKRNCVSNSNRYSKRHPCSNNIISAAICCIASYFNVGCRCLFHFKILYG